MNQGLMLHITGILAAAVEQLEGKASKLQIENIALNVYRAMGNPSRQFHNHQHVFSFFPTPDAVSTLAALFHDIVYLQVDGAFPVDARVWLDQHLRCPVNADGCEDSSDVGIPRLRPDAEQEKPWFKDLRVLFGLEDGHRFSPFTAFNEFFSCLAFFHCFETILDRSKLFAVAACIEASIPFRSDEKSDSCSLALATRLQGAGFTEAEAREMTERAVLFANQDVADFCAEDVGVFLSGTWKLLPETNRSLRVQGVYTIQEYRKALQGMEAFFSFLKAERIFHRYASKPTEEELQKKIQLARHNLLTAQEYLQAKLLGIAFLEAVALETGGDTALSYVMGDLSSDGARLEDYLPPLTELRCKRGDVYRLLASGRMSESSFDLKNSPLSLYFYGRLDPKEFKDLVSKCKDFFGAKLKGREFLAAYGSGTAIPVLRGLKNLAPSRDEGLAELEKMF